MITSIDIPQGYKSSPLGIIPKDWEVKRLGEVAIFQNGYSFDSNTFSNEGDYVIRISDIQNRLVLLNNATHSTTNVPEEFKVVYGDILIAMSGATTGKIGEYKNKEIAYINQRVGNIKPFNLNKKLLLFMLQSVSFTNYLNNILTIGAQPNISAQQICSFPILIPPLAEQERIAELLGTWDRAIEMQKQLIEKLELRKKGLMQQLLTGKKRLPGFTGEWKKVRLGEVCTISTGKLDANAMVDNGAYMFFTCSKENYLTDTYAFDGEALLISGNGEVGIVKYYNGKFNAYQRTYVLQNFAVNVQFLRLYIEHFLPQRVLRERNVGAMPYIILSTLSEMCIDLPSAEEQLRIASFIENNESEQMVATQKHASLQAQKQGLMQVLLTGKKRI